MFLREVDLFTNFTTADSQNRLGRKNSALSSGAQRRVVQSLAWTRAIKSRMLKIVKNDIVAGDDEKRKQFMMEFVEVK